MRGHFTLNGKSPQACELLPQSDLFFREKSTCKSIGSCTLASGEFVVNLVTEELFDAMNISAADFPADVSERAAENLQAAKNPEFERATELRDQLKKLRESVLISPL